MSHLVILCYDFLYRFAFKISYVWTFFIVFVQTLGPLPESSEYFAAFIVSLATVFRKTGADPVFKMYAF